MTLVQSGTSLGEIAGTLGSFAETIAGSVSADGRLSLRGTLTIRDFDYRDVVIATLQVGSWETNLDDAGGMTGRWAEDFTSLAGRLGTAHTRNELVTMNRVSTTVLPASAHH